MILVDANLLLYAYDASSKFHARARPWLEELLSGADPVGLAWVTLLAFLRIGTNPRALTRPLPLGEAVQIVSSWLAQPGVVRLEPGDRHWEILSRLLEPAQARGPLVMDAHLAALAIEHGAVLATSDRDFSRFDGLRTVNPLAGDP
jgi:toxin-antitoxin system PIN domain toxin